MPKKFMQISTYRFMANTTEVFKNIIFSMFTQLKVKALKTQAVVTQIYIYNLIV